MVTIAEELPYVYIVDDKYVKTTCSYCFAANIIEEGLDKLVDLKKCGRCQNIYYCSVKCQREDWEHHKSECTFLVNAKSCPDLYVRFVSRAIMRVKSGTFALSFNGRYFNDLVDHADDIIASPPVYHYIKTLYNELVKYMGAENVPPEKDVISIYGKLRTNSMAITSSDGLEAVGHGLYLGLSAHDHSCRPDCAYTFVGPMAILRAKDRNTKYNTDLTLSYVPLTLPRKIRQERLQEGYFFFCQCERCMDEEEDLLERSGKSTCCSDGVVLPRDNGRPLVCSKCGKTTSLTLQKIINANKELLRYSREPNKMISHREAEEYKKLFYKMERILSPYNLYLLRIVEVMSDIYFDFIDERIYFFRAEKKVLKRYAPFSGQMIMILRCIFNSERELVIDCMTQRQYDRVIDAGKKLYAALREFCDPEYYLTKEVKEEVNEFIKEKALI